MFINQKTIKVSKRFLNLCTRSTEHSSALYFESLTLLEKLTLFQT